MRGLIQISQLDMLRHTSMVEEFGDPSLPGDFESLMQWRSYHHIMPSVHPPVMIQVGDDDRVTLPFHGYKTLAALQTDQLGRAQILPQVAWSAGHSQGFDLEQRIETHARQHLFLRRALRLTPDR
ncbi:MAG: prolyl oligopeptidase family serine peptidase [Planctomycetota bacterium]